MLKSISKLGTELSKSQQKLINGGKTPRCCNPTNSCCDPDSYPSNCLAYGNPNAHPVPYCM